MINSNCVSQSDKKFKWDMCQLTLRLRTKQVLAHPCFLIPLEISHGELLKAGISLFKKKPLSTAVAI